MSREPSTDLVERLFVPWDRLGWEYVTPAPPVPSPEADRMPLWVEPLPPGTAPPYLGVAVPPGAPPAAMPSPPPARAGSSNAAKVALLVPILGCGGIPLSLALSALVQAFGPGPVVLILVVVVAVVAFAVIRPPVQRRRARARFLAARDAAFAAYQQEVAAWRERVARHDRAEGHRYTTALRWYPLTPWSGAERIDVFGGTADGWASLLATLGSSMLRRGASVLLLDLTEQRVGDGLAEFAAARDHPVRRLSLPEQWSSWRPSTGLTADEYAEVLAEAVHGMRAANGNAATVDGRALDAELLGAVLARLDRPWTFRRIAAGARVLRRLYQGADDPLLSDAERRRLSDAIDSVGHTDRVAQELQFLTSVLDLLAADEPAAPAADQSSIVDEADELLGGGLAVVCTGGTHRRRKDALDRVVFHRLIRVVRDAAWRSGETVVVVAGADHLGRDGLEDLARQAERSGVRLVLMLERLRGDVHDLLGGRHSATVLMRLNNAREAGTAAEFVGRGHTFVLSQLTQQVGATFTEGTASSYGVSDGLSEGSSANLSDGRIGSVAIPFASISNATSSTRTRTQTWQDTVNRSLAGSVTAGHTLSRVYEFTVEPTTLQSLPATAFVMVEPGPTGRRVALGDCNPGIVLLDLVADEPRRP